MRSLAGIHVVLQHLILSHRLRQAGQSCLAVLCGLRKASWSVWHSRLCCNVQDVALPHDPGLLCSRVDQVVVHATTSADENGQDLLAHTGVLAGDSWASEHFALS